MQFLQDNGGDPRNVGEDYIEAYVPVTLLGAVSEQPGVIRVRGDCSATAGIRPHYQPGGSELMAPSLGTRPATPARASRWG